MRVIGCTIIFSSVFSDCGAGGRMDGRRRTVPTTVTPIVPAPTSPLPVITATGRYSGYISLIRKVIHFVNRYRPSPLVPETFMPCLHETSREAVKLVLPCGRTTILTESASTRGFVSLGQAASLVAVSDR